MGPLLGTLIDFTHALLMAAWVIGLPLLFLHKWPRLARAYAFYAVAFVVVNQISERVLGECFLTTLARMAYSSSSSGRVVNVSDEWFTVRLSRAIFRMTPDRPSIKTTSEVLILVTALGVAYRGLVKRRKGPGPAHTLGAIAGALDPAQGSDSPREDA